jgi:thiamine pyrophosphate-dependent acetolactate synthase large subunit-like protein
MKMFGGQGTTITDPELLKPVLETAFPAGTPYCVNVVIDPETPLPNAWGEQGSDRGSR